MLNVLQQLIVRSKMGLPIIWGRKMISCLSPMDKSKSIPRHHRYINWGSLVGGTQLQRKLPPDWQEMKDDASGKNYYYNQRTGESRWDFPVDQPPLPQGWQELVDGTSNRVYYYNQQSGASQWERPVDSINNTQQEKLMAQSTQTPLQNEASSPPSSVAFASRIEGHESQILFVDLQPNQAVRAESGALLFMTEGVEMQTSTGGGLWSALRRGMTGANFMVTDFRNTRPDAPATVALGADFPAKIIPVPLEEHGGALICCKGAFLAGPPDLAVEMHATGLATGLIGGQGLILQRISGTGTAYLKAGGLLTVYRLQPGETMRATRGVLLAFSPSVTYDVGRVKGITNMLMSGEGLFMVTLTGPGTVYLQSMPFERLFAALGGGGGGGGGVTIGPGGGRQASTTDSSAGAAAGDGAAADPAGADDSGGDADGGWGDSSDSK